eukprot:CAMPEP_0113449206 /NCGR_PEP_ID=MMETSP0014_2-20120614/5172_1 /TAXON_ID=2857 /ORGANISM="Nitzschia sp." /LENGTH=829 /DNA_ID=CAMNT_0000340461 /DNA_START=201 /DNA_END=2691 /DNA_ORIENTATION=- /assembly_acc=CAM_ASM_000159
MMKDPSFIRRRGRRSSSSSSKMMMMTMGHINFVIGALAVCLLLSSSGGQNYNIGIPCPSSNPILVFVEATTTTTTTTTSNNNNDNNINQNRRRQLVVIAGPHQSGSNSMYQFFDRYATKYDDDDDKDDEGNSSNSRNGSSSSKITGWNWPTLESKELEMFATNTTTTTTTGSTDEKGRHEIFDYLFSSSSSSSSIDHVELQQTLLKSIRDAWTTTQGSGGGGDGGGGGVFLGSDEFEKVGGTSPSTDTINSSSINNNNDAALSVLFRIKENLSIPSNEDVTIVLLYQRRRVDQLSRLIREHHNIGGGGGGGGDDPSYEDFICSVQENDDYNDKWNDLDVSMNPLWVATEYLRAGFNVLLVDTEEIEARGGDVSHAVICTLPGVGCFDDSRWIESLHHARTPSLSEMSNIIDDELDDELVNDLNKILRQRDCYWAGMLANDPNFKVLDGKYTNNFFSDCGQDTMSEFRYSRTNFLLYTMQKQLGCQGESPGLNDTDLPPQQITSTDEDKKNKTAFYALLSFLGVFLLLALYLCSCMLYRKQYCIRKKPTDNDDGFFKDDDDIIKLPRMPFSDEIPNLAFPSSSSPSAATMKDGLNTSSQEEEKDTRNEKEAGSGWVKTRSIMTGIATTNFPRLAAKSHESSIGDLCKACKMVGVDPKCPFCHGGGKQKKNTFIASSPKSVLDDATEFVGDGVDDLDDRDMMHLCTYCTSGFGTPSPDCATCSAGKLTIGNGYNDLNERWHGEVRHQVAEPPDLEENFQGRYEISESSSDAATAKEPRKSRAMSKLKQLRGLKEAELLDPKQEQEDFGSSERFTYIHSAPPTDRKYEELEM